MPNIRAGTPHSKGLLDMHAYRRNECCGCFLKQNILLGTFG